MDSKTPTNPVGRPSKYKPEYCQMLLDHMEKGFSLEAFGGVVRVCRETIFEWIKDHEEFSNAARIGRTLSLLRWEEFGKEMMMGKVFGGSSTIYTFNMKNRFGWRDNPEPTEENKPKQKVYTLNYERKKKPEVIE